ncbi:cellulose synthase/poly-beta-1,6-N-acetylglucosamine synthase-like glycosyltransferase [Filimonas zeae]|uniref:Glycosyl transferase n=1 Tax=Filimonas zeae TaxID=1737353 RepID=A0A917J4R9_9BACT|nr:glycosyltransferase [Filimonas zeae]MDR6341838.1 cellulose synthase/poly-beta-1,6-N-acetylglucosamine synthase-like glycosyltransferase [Filimonas zeae]GGH80136.1 glycosyl transferase [Filimonas zeae]
MPLTLISILWIILQVLIGYHLVMPVLMYIAHLLFIRHKTLPQALKESDYGIIVTAYEQTNTLPAVVRSLLQLNYSNYMIYIVADKCDVSDLHFNDERVVVLRPPETLASNTRSHFYAIHRFVRAHDRLTIIDSDNLAHPDYLKELDVFFNNGFRAVQGVRMAKNLNTTYACLDAARDIYYHYYDGKILFELGSSATLAGSGMAFETALYRECLEHNDVTGAGFDKVLQAAIVKKNIQIAFAEKALVYDEKTSESAQLVNQRARWINTWFKYFGYGFSILGYGLKNMSRNQLLFGLVLLRPPLFIFLILSGLFLFINIWLSVSAVIIWAVALLLFVAGFGIALALSHTDKRIYRSLVNIPKFMFFQVLSLLRARTANKRSVATTHYHSSEIEDIS